MLAVFIASDLDKAVLVEGSEYLAAVTGAMPCAYQLRNDVLGALPPDVMR